MKNKEKRILVILIICVIIQSIFYALTKVCASTPTVLTSEIDNKIVFNTLAIIPYCLWYIMLFTVPFMFYKNDKNLFMKYIVSYLIVSLIADIIFIIYPTTVIRPEIINNDLLSTLTKLIYFIDTPSENCFPSLHCAVSMLWIFYSLKCKNSSWYIKTPIIIMSILIMISTVVIKQHVVIDIIGGIFIAIVAYVLMGIYENKIIKINKYLKI